MKAATVTEAREGNGEVRDGGGVSFKKPIYQIYNKTFSAATVFNPIVITSQLSATDASLSQELPRRMCGDWSPKLKLLRYVTKIPALALHFVSDYSHQYGGYKAKVYIQNSKLMNGS